MKRSDRNAAPPVDALDSPAERPKSNGNATGVAVGVTALAAKYLFLGK